MADRYARAVLSGRFRNAGQAARAMLQERDGLRRRFPGAGWLKPDRTGLAAHLKIIKRLRALGRPLAWAPNTPAEKELYDRYARDVIAGRYPSVRAASRACLQDMARRRSREPGGRWPRLRRGLAGVQAQIQPRVRALGRPARFVPWTPREMRAVADFAYRLRQKRYPTLQSAAQGLRQALQRVGPGRLADGRPIAPRGEFSVFRALQAYSRRIGRRIVHLRRWSEPELRVLNAYARSVMRGRYRRCRDAAEDAQREFADLRRRYPDAAWLAVARNTPSIELKLLKLTKSMGRPRAFPRLVPPEERMIQAYARRVVSREFNARQAAREYVRRTDLLRRKYPKLEWVRLRRSDRSIHLLILKRARRLGRPLLQAHWSAVELAALKPCARGLLAGRFPNSRAAGQVGLKEIEALRERHPEARWAEMKRTAHACGVRITGLAHTMAEYWPDTRWTRGEQAVVDRYARLAVQGRFRSAGEAGAACQRDLANRLRHRLRRDLRGIDEVRPRSVQAVTTRLLKRSHELGRPRRPGRWSDSEIQLARKWAEAHHARRHEYRGFTYDTAAKGLLADLKNQGLRRTRVACVSLLSVLCREMRAGKSAAG